MSVKNVFLIGAMKCGTNTLYHALKNHPAISIPRTKELDFFLEGSTGEDYLAEFELTDRTVATLDGTTQYSKYPAIKHIPEAIHAYNPDALIVYMMRDPVARLESNVAHNIARGSGATLDNWRESGVLRNALNFGKYYTQLSLYTRLFPREQIFTGVFESFVRDQASFLAALCTFIGVDPADLEIKNQVRNPRRLDNGVERFAFDDDDDKAFALQLRDDIDCLKETFGVEPGAHWDRYERAIAHG